MASLSPFPTAWSRCTLSLSALNTFVNVLLSSTVTRSSHFLFIGNSFEFWFDSSNIFAKSCHYFAISSSQNDLFRNIRSFCSSRSIANCVWVCTFERRRKIVPLVDIFYVFSFRRFRHRHRGNKVEPLLRVCGNAHCTWLSFDTKYEGKLQVGFLLD